MSVNYTKAEFVALDNYLSYWPNGMSYADVIERLNTTKTRRDDSENAVDVVGDYEDLWPEHVAQLITALHDQLVSVYGE